MRGEKYERITYISTLVSSMQEENVTLLSGIFAVDLKLVTALCEKEPWMNNIVIK